MKFRLGLFDSDKENLRIDVKNHPIVAIITILLFLSISMILAYRDFGIAKDDYNYLNYFYYTNRIQPDNWLLYLIEEPLWKLLTLSMTFILSPESALRLTIFISSSLFLFSVNRINSRLFLIVSVIFIFGQYFATQMYFNQLRQGLALSVFLCLSVYGKKPLLGGVLATLIHTSFIFPLIIIILLTKVKSIKWIIIYSVLLVIALYLSINILGVLDLGRRTNIYSFEGKFNINYYISTFVRYIPLLCLMQFYGNKSNYSFWYKMALSSFLIIVPFTLFYNAAGRLMYYVSTFFLLMILGQRRSWVRKVGLAYYLLFLFCDLLFFESYVISNWRLILNI